MKLIFKNINQIEKILNIKFNYKSIIVNKIIQKFKIKTVLLIIIKSLRKV